LIAAVTTWTAIGVAFVWRIGTVGHAALLGAAVCVTLGIAANQFERRPRWQKVASYSAIAAAFLGALTLLVLPVCAYVQGGAARNKSHNNLKQIALTIHNYAEANGHLAPAAIRAKDGTPLLSWRVAILPYIESDNSGYLGLKLDEPWDSPHNLKMLGNMPRIYRVPGQDRDETTTYYQVLIGKSTAFERDGLKLTDFYNGTSNVILVVEAANSVPWTKPEDIPFDDEPLLPKLGGPMRNRWFSSADVWSFTAVMADGSVQTHFGKEIDEATVRRMAVRE
jgi:hypothetical protein